MKTLFLAAAVVMVGCGGGAPAKTSDTVATAGSAPAAAAVGDCESTLVSKAPDGWVPAGKVVIKVDGGQPKHVDATDTAGKTTMSSDVDDTKAGKDTMLKSICSAAGPVAVAVAPKTDPTGSSVTLPIFKPTSTDPAIDLASMCKPPTGIPADFDPSQRMRVAVAGYNDTLVSTKWRAWLNQIGKELAAAKSDEDAVAAKAKYGDELAKAAGPSSCWFADALHGKL